MGGWWVTETWNAGPIYFGSWVFWVIFSIVLHELAHGWAAIWQGDRTPIFTGHMTWNPLVHMGQMSLLFFALFGLAWGAMPVQPSNFRSRYGDAMVSFAGPLMNFLLFILCLIGLVLWVMFAQGMSNQTVYGNVDVFLRHGAFLNIVLGLFHLLPVPPLDGSRILGDFVPAYHRIWMGERGQILGIIAFVFVMLFGMRLVIPIAHAIVGTLLSALGGSTP